VYQICSIYSSKRKTFKWWKSVFYYLLDICVFNASILFYEQSYVKKMKINSKMFHFRNELCKYYFKNYIKNTSPIKIPEQTFKHFPQRHSRQRECKNCQRKRQRGQKNVRKTIWTCIDCNIPLCVELSKINLLFKEDIV